MSWRDQAKPIIAEVIKRVGTDDESRLRKELRAAFPFGPKAYHPYRIWLDEIKRQLGTKVVKDHKGEPETIKPLPGQKELF